MSNIILHLNNVNRIIEFNIYFDLNKRMYSHIFYDFQLTNDVQE